MLKYFPNQGMIKQRQTIADVLKDERRYLREGYPYTFKSASRLNDICVKLGKDTTCLPTGPPLGNGEDDHKLTPFGTLLQTRGKAREVLKYDDLELLSLKRELVMGHETLDEKIEVIATVQEVLE